MQVARTVRGGDGAAGKLTRKLGLVTLAAWAAAGLLASTRPARAQQESGVVLSDGQISLPFQWRGIKRKRQPAAVPYTVFGAQPKSAFSPLNGCSNATLTYYDGPVISNVQIVPVFWSSHVNSQLTAATTGIAQFYADVTLGNAFGALSEYNTNVSGGTGQVIGAGTALAAVTLTPSRCAGTTKCTVTDAQVQSELNAQIGAGNLPPITHDTLGNPNTLYMVHFPPNVTIDASTFGGGTSCVSFCAYHNTGTSSGGEPLLYGVLPDMFTSECNSGCGGNATAMENQTSTASHELAESVTDADVGFATGNAYPLGWYNESCGEVADICDTGAAGGTITVSGRTWTVQPLWSNKTKSCLVGDTYSQSAYPPSIWTGNSAGSLSAIVEDSGVYLAKSAYTGGGLATIVGPQGVAFDSSGNIWIANTGTTGISEFNLDGTAVTSTAYTTGISSPGALAVDGSSTVWVANGNGTVTQLSSAGAVVSTTTDASFSGPTGLAIDSSGNVWVANGTTSTVDVIIGAATPTAPLSTALAAGTQGGKP